MQIEIFTDGSGTSRDKAAGYGWVMVTDSGHIQEGNGHMPEGTNNDAEMQAAIAGLTAVLKFVLIQKAYVPDLSVNVILCSDSQITLGWADGSYKFKQEHKYERFTILKELMKRLNAKTRWVKGHSGHIYNERCDVLANLGRHGLGPNDTLPGKKKPSQKSLTLKAAQAEIARLRLLLAKALPAMTWFFEGPYGNSPDPADLIAIRAEVNRSDRGDT